MKIKSLIAMVAVGLGLVSVSHADAYWRWTSNATDETPVWTEVDSDTLSVPAFEGATAADNVLELIEDCAVEDFLVFNKSCTIRTAPGLDVKKVTFANNCYCISTAGADIHTADITFTGGAQWSYPTPQYQWFWNASAGNSTTAGNCAWAVIGTASLTLGAGTTVRDFLSAVPTGIGGTSYGAAIMLPDQTTKDSPLGQKNCSQDSPALTISEGAKILDVRSNNSPAIFIGLYSAKAVVTMTGGEISECYNGNGGPNYAGTIYVGNGTFNLSGGTIHGNYAHKSDYAGINVYNGALLLSGTPIVQNNYKSNGKNVTSNHEPRNLKVSGSGSIHLAGDLEEGASVGCSQNIGENNEFGVADGEYAGAQRIHADGSELVGKRDSAKLVWATASEPLPTVGGQEVEPDKVFDLAREAKPITYPSAPEVSGAEGSQRIDFGSVSVEVPRHYTASVEGNVVTIKLNRNAEPTIADSDGGEKKGIEIADGQVKIHFEPQAAGLFYTLETATEPQGEWTPAEGPQAETDFSVSVDGDHRFYRIKVSD